MEKKTYNVGDRILVQQELTLNEAIRLKQLIGDGDRAGEPEAFLALLNRKDFTDDFFRIILKGDLPETGITDWLPASVGMDIIADFFLFNSALIQGWLLYLETRAPRPETGSGKR